MTVKPADGPVPCSTATRFAYDVFVIHADAATDEAFVNGYLLAQLGLAPDRVLRLQTLELGESMIGEIERGVRSSRVTIVVLSSAHMDNDWTAFGERLAAYASVAKQVHGVLLPLLLEDCQLTMHVQSLVRLDFRDPARAAWEAEVERLRAYLDRPAAEDPDLPCPYPGMRPFTERDAGRFFGRDIELDRIVRRLGRGEREIYVIGASGSGKSSLIAAGLVPRLARGVEGLPSYHVRSFRPGERPLDQLASALEGDIAAPAAAVDALLVCHAPGAALLLVVDQLEELFTIADVGQRRDFLAAVDALRSNPHCVFVFTLRADFYGAFMESSLWTAREGRISRTDLGPLSSESLRTIIERPARDLDVYVQPELVSRLLDDAAREPGVLPLLQETLFQLWGKRRQRLLALADYHALGDGARTGLAFAVKEHADDVLGALSDAQRAIAFRILLRLVNFGEGRADTRRQQLRAALRSDGEDATDFDAVLRRLVDNRLVTVSDDDLRREVRVDLAHEILIHAWPSFADLIRTWRVHEQRRRDLEAAAAAWRARGSGDGGLLDALELAGALAWKERAAQPLGHTSDLAAFLSASAAARSHAARTRRRRIRLAFGGVALFAVVTSTLALVAMRNAQEAEHRGQEASRLLRESARAYEEDGRQRLLEGERPLEALPYLVTAREATETSGGTPSVSLRMLFAAATRNLPVSPPLRHQGPVWSAAFSPDGTRVVTASGDKTARVWDAVTSKPLSPPLQHQATVWSAAFSPDGTRVATASWDKTARVWDAATGKPLSLPLAHQNNVTSAAFSPDGSHVVTASWDKTARVWDAATGKPLSPPLPHQGTVWGAVFSPDGRRIVTASDDGTARVWDAATGEPLSPSLPHQGAVGSAAFSPDGSRVVTASGDKTARVWDVATGKPLTPPLPHQDTVVSAAFSPDGSRVVTASADKTARVWDAATGKPLTPSIQHQGAALNAVFSADGGRVVTASGDGTARIWDAATGKPLSPPLQHQSNVASAAFSPDGGRVVTASWDGTARIWDASVGAGLSPPLQHQGTVWSAAFSPDGTRVVTGSWDGTARLWDSATGELLSPSLPHPGNVTSAAFSPDGSRVVTASGDGTARIWDVATGEPLSPPLPHHGTVGSAAFSPDGARVVTASGDKTARVWDAATGEPLSPPLSHRSEVRSTGFSPDGTRVVTASEDGTARVWDAMTGRPLSPLLQHQGAVVSAAFSPDGLRVVTAGGDGTARVWDATTGRPLSPPLQHQGTVGSAAFSPDGVRVVTASEDGTARIWDAATGRPVSPPLQHQGAVMSAAFSPDGLRVVTASVDHTARVWNLLPPALGSLADWDAVADRASPYVIANGVLSLKP